MFKVLLFKFRRHLCKGLLISTVKSGAAAKRSRIGPSCLLTRVLPKPIKVSISVVGLNVPRLILASSFPEGFFKRPPDISALSYSHTQIPLQSHGLRQHVKVTMSLLNYDHARISCQKLQKLSNRTIYLRHALPLSRAALSSQG